MPSKVDPNDWDRFFSPTGPRHSGPLGLFVRTTLIVGFLGGLGYGLFRFKGYVDTQRAYDDATATAVKVAAAPTQTAQAFAALLEQTAQALPSPTPALPTARIRLQAPLRPAPNEGASGTGEVFPNDVVQVVSTQDVAGVSWLQIRVTDIVNPAAGVAPGSEGWVPADVVGPQTIPPTVTPGASAPSVAVDGATLQFYRDPQTGITLQSPRSWALQTLPTLQRGFFLAPALDSPEGAVVASVINAARDAEAFQAAMQQVAQSAAKFGTTTQITVTSTTEQTMLGTVSFTRMVGNQDVLVKAPFRAQAASGGTIGVVLAFVPEGSYGANETTLNLVVSSTQFP